MMLWTKAVLSHTLRLELLRVFGGGASLTQGSTGSLRDQGTSTWVFGTVSKSLVT